MKTLFLWLACLAAALPLNGKNAARSLPFQLKKNLILIDIQVNGGAPLHFIFDTGAGVTVLDRKAAAKLDLVITGKGKLNTSGKSVEAITSFPNQLQLGPNILDNVSLEIISLEHLSDYLGLPLGGVIGYDLLKEFVVETDIDQGQMRLFDPADFCYSGPGAEMEVIPMDYNHFGLELSFRQKKKSEVIKASFKIDTAFEDYLILHNSTLKRYGLLEDKKYKELSSFGAEATLVTNFQGKLREVTLAGKKWKNVKCVFEVDPITIRAREKTESDGFIGQELLLDFNITYDLSGGKIYLEER